MNGFPMNDQAALADYNQLHSYLTGDATIAIERVERFLKSHHDFAQAHNDLGVLYHRSGDLLRSLAHYEKANRLQPDNPGFRKNLADFYATELGWVDDAILIFTEMLRNAPNDTEILGSLAVISFRIGQPQEAATFLGKILLLEPWNTDARRMLDDILSGEGPAGPSNQGQDTQPETSSLDEVLSGLRQSISRMTVTTRPPEESYREALRLSEQGMAAEAASVLEELVQSSPEFALAYNDLGVLFCQLGDLGRSLAAHQQAVRLEPLNPVFGKNLANLYYAALGRTDDAITIFTGILKDYPNDVETLLALAQISLANNCREQARIFVVKALELEPWNSDAREFFNNLA